MAQFVAINNKVEVNRQTVLSIVNSMDKSKDVRLDILLKNGINPDESEWFNQQKWLNAFRDISVSLGEMNLFLIGKAIVTNAKFPPIKDLEEGLRSINIAYHMNHRVNGKIMFDSATGEITEGIGDYQLIEFDEKVKRAVMKCSNPYPSKFDEGIIVQVVRRFKSSGSIENIRLDLSKESRIRGGNSCTFSISW